MEHSIETTGLPVRLMLWPLLAALLLATGLCTVVQPGLAAEPPAIPTPEFAVLNGEPISTAKLSQGRWAVAFVILPGCPACEWVIEWFERAGQAFPQGNFILATRAATPEFTSFVNEHAASVQVLLDSDGSLGGSLGVTRAPTVILFMEGAQIGWLDWPFTQQELRQALEESISVEFRIPDPNELLGQPAPEFTAVALTRTKISLTDLPLPLLLSFFNPNCPPCWDVLPALVEASTKVPVVMLTFVGEEGLSDQHRVRFAEFGAEAGKMMILILTGFQVIDAYQITATPTTFLINRKGVITWIALGDTDGLAEALGTVHSERQYGEGYE